MQDKSQQARSAETKNAPTTTGEPDEAITQEEFDRREKLAEEADKKRAEELAESTKTESTQEERDVGARSALVDRVHKEDLEQVRKDDVNRELRKQEKEELERPKGPTPTQPIAETGKQPPAPDRHPQDHLNRPTQLPAGEKPIPGVKPPEGTQLPATEDERLKKEKEDREKKAKEEQERANKAGGKK